MTAAHSPIVAVRPEGQLPVCPQCRREVVLDGGWRHLDDYSSQCAPGTAEAVRGVIRWVTGQSPPLAPLRASPGREAADYRPEVTS